MAPTFCHSCLNRANDIFVSQRWPEAVTRGFLVQQTSQTLFPPTRGFSAVLCSPFWDKNDSHPAKQRNIHGNDVRSSCQCCFFPGLFLSWLLVCHDSYCVHQGYIVSVTKLMLCFWQHVDNSCLIWMEFAELFLWATVSNLTTANVLDFDSAQQEIALDFLSSTRMCCDFNRSSCLRLKSMGETEIT